MANTDNRMVMQENCILHDRAHLKQRGLVIPSDEELCDMTEVQLRNIGGNVVVERLLAARLNKFKRHQELGDLLVKINQLLSNT